MNFIYLNEILSSPQFSELLLVGSTYLNLDERSLVDLSYMNWNSSSYKVPQNIFYLRESSNKFLFDLRRVFLHFPAHDLQTSRSCSERGLLRRTCRTKRTLRDGSLLPDLWSNAKPS